MSPRESWAPMDMPRPNTLARVSIFTTSKKILLYDRPLTAILFIDFHIGHLYVKSDVYGFGAVLLEMLSGQRAFDPSRPSGQHNFVEYSKPHLADRRKLAQLMDPRLEGQYPSKGARLAAQLTLKCLMVDPKSRPSMKEVVQALEQIELETLKGRPRSVSQSSSHSQQN